MNRKTEDIKKIIVSKPLKLDCGKTINDFPLAYETYGTLNENKDNAILVFHALTGDQFVTGTNPVTNKEGWWVTAVGPGKAIDTNKYFVICANVIGGCMGSWGPSNNNKETNQPYGLDFPVITIKDIVKAQESLLDYLGIKNFYVPLEDQWVECNYYNFVRPFLTKLFLQFLSHVAQVIVHKILR
jgi:homoserine O-acetyltransferase